MRHEDLGVVLWRTDIIMIGSNARDLGFPCLGYRQVGITKEGGRGTRGVPLLIEWWSQRRGVVHAVDGGKRGTLSNLQG